MPPLSSPIRWGILGCGDVTEVKSGPAFQRCRDSQLVAVMRRDSAKAADYARRHHVPRWYDDARALIADPEVDALYIATPPGNHLDSALLVAAAGKPAYIEKPLARSAAEGQQILAAFAAAQRPVFAAYYRRALPRFVHARQLLTSGALGVLTHVSYHYASPPPRLDPDHLPWRLDATHAGAGLFLDLGSHALDLLDFFLGPLTWKGGHAANLATPLLPVEDTVAFAFRTTASVPGVASWNFAASHHEDAFVFTGTQARLRFTCFGQEPLLLEPAHGPAQTFDLPHPAHVQEPLIQTVVDALLGRADCPSTGLSAQRTAHLMDQALSPHYGDRTTPFWTHPTTWPGHPAKPKTE